MRIQIAFVAMVIMFMLFATVPAFANLAANATTFYAIEGNDEYMVYA